MWPKWEIVEYLSLLALYIKPSNFLLSLIKYDQLINFGLFFNTSLIHIVWALQCLETGNFIY